MNNSMRKVFATVAIALMLIPSVSSAATMHELEAQRLALMEQLIVLLQARVAELLAMRDAQGLVLGVSTSTVSTMPTTTSSTEVVKKKRKSGGGGGGGSRNNNVVPPVEEPTPVPTTTPTTTPEEEEDPAEAYNKMLQQMISDLIAQVNSLLAEENKTLGDCVWIVVGSELNTESLQLQINQLLNAIVQLQDGETTINGCPLLDTSESSGPRLRFRASAEDPDAMYIGVSQDEITNNVLVFAYDLEAVDGDITLETLFVRVVTGEETSIDDVVHGATLTIDGEEFEGEVYAIEDSYTDFAFPIGGSVTLLQGSRTGVGLYIDFEPALYYAEGDWVNAFVPSDLVDMTVAVSSSTLSADQLIGLSSGVIHGFVLPGLSLSGVDTAVDLSGENDTIGQFTIGFDATAIGDNDLYVRAHATTSSGVPLNARPGAVYRLEGGEGFVTAFLTSTADEDSPDVFTVKNGETETFTLGVTIDPDTTGQYRVCLEGTIHSTNPDGHTNGKYQAVTDESEFCTNWITINAD